MYDLLIQFYTVLNMLSKFGCYDRYIIHAERYISLKPQTRSLHPNHLFYQILINSELLYIELNKLEQNISEYVRHAFAINYRTFESIL